MATAQTTAGTVRGTDEAGVHVFRGIPFAAPPAGPRRFAAPERPEPWTGERDATAFGPVCQQQPMPGIFGEIGTAQHPHGDDCLRLNVWTPDLAARLPVLVWIHGGAFYGGSGIDDVYHGTRFAQNGVVVVTINYRLGAQGYLHLADHFPELAESGNAGTLDQIAALEWVQENIAAFGGDPGQVTIAGESAGGMSVATLMAAPRARGLFRAAIPQSGAGHNGVSAATASRMAGYLLEQLGVAAGDRAALDAVTADRLLAAQITLSEEIGTSQDVERYGELAGSAMWLQPTFDTPVLPQRPIEAIAAGAAAGIDVMIGNTTEEALIFVRDIPDQFPPEVIEQVANAMMGAGGRSGADALAVYRRNRPGADDVEIVAAFQSDLMFRIPTLRLADAQVKHHPRTWVYEFGWRSTALGGRYGACHFLEVPFAFDQLDNDAARGIAGEPPPPLADLVHPAWVAFVKSGDPNHGGLPDWEPWEVGRRPTMRFDLPSALVLDPAADERALWEGVL